MVCQILVSQWQTTPLISMQSRWKQSSTSFSVRREIYWLGWLFLNLSPASFRCLVCWRRVFLPIKCLYCFLIMWQASQVAQVVKNLPVSAGDIHRHGFDPWGGKIPWRRKWKPTLIFLPGKSHGHRSLVGYGPWGCKRVAHDLVTKPPSPPYVIYHRGLCIQLLKSPLLLFLPFLPPLIYYRTSSASSHTR